MATSEVPVTVADRRTRRQETGRWRAATIGSVVAGVVLVIAGCGAAGAATPKARAHGSGRPVLSAYVQTVSSKTADMTLTETVTEGSSSSLPQEVVITGTGSVDFTTGNGGLTFSSSATGAYADRFITPVLYVQLPAADSRQLPAGKTWVSVDLNTVSEAKLGQSLAQLADSSQQSTQSLSYLEGVSSSGITTVGPSTIRGVATTEYRATVDLTKVADQKSPAEDAAIKGIEAELHTTTFPIQVWLDARGRVRQVSTQVHDSTGAQTASGTTVPAASGSVTTTVDYFDFGVPVTVVPPPAAQVDDVTQQVVAAGSSTTTTAAVG
jgi:hypothetical protein